MNAVQDVHQLRNKGFSTFGPNQNRGAKYSDIQCRITYRCFDIYRILFCSVSSEKEKAPWIE